MEAAVGVGADGAADLAATVERCFRNVRRAADLAAVGTSNVVVTTTL